MSGCVGRDGRLVKPEPVEPGSISFTVPMSWPKEGQYGMGRVCAGQKVTVTKLSNSFKLVSENMGQKLVELEVSKKDLKRLVKFIREGLK